MQTARIAWSVQYCDYTTGWLSRKLLAGAWVFSLLHRLQNHFAVHATSCLTVDKEFFSGIKQLRCEADYSPTPSTEVKNSWNYTSILPCIVACCWLNTRATRAFTWTLVLRYEWIRAVLCFICLVTCCSSYFVPHTCWCWHVFY